ncbi:ABC transporter substrate-binding protein [Nonomuraea gerenzanensis]|uniref:Periplasmic binding protein n=1 Tax=Nonomuraea gerenzanensis TaxID=93944 RepID=A0A1M4E2H4_9ACTN|nr:iron-siderophore ABC transporter substrate-binding protein [Nonomuraea gerenzanensis]UBU15250.1 iron-siderophore ABC transporter substrate-binding protein [Nonomuraea gerenzanensis]SBO92993.1 periplasmic binding protein [Nonomuraea gerenzanensis]
MRLRLAIAAMLPVLALTACGTSTTAQEAGPTRTVKHAMGETKVPMTPKRVVVLDTDKLDTMVSLGLSPVGAAQAQENQTWPEYLGSALADTKPVGTLQQLNLEAIMALKPDLILGSKFRQAAFYDKLAKIAPTVFTEKVGITWKENFLLDAEALGKKDQAQQLLSAYETRAEEVGAKFSKLQVGIVRFMPTEIRLYGPESFSGIVLGDAGIPRPEAQQLADQEDKRFGKISQENIAKGDADAIFYTAYGEAAAKSQAEVTAGPLWKNLKAVKAEHAFNVDDEIWMTGIGVTAAGKILDDLDKHLTPLA